jgi:hypothetical protein
MKSARSIDPSKIIIPHGKLIKELIKRNLNNGEKVKNDPGQSSRNKNQFLQ